MPGLPPPKNNNNDKNKKNIVNNYKNNDNFNVDMVEGTFNNIFDFNKIINFNLESAIKDKLERKPDGNLIAFFKSSTKLYELIVNPNFKDNYSNYLTNKAVFEESTLDEICDNELKDNPYYKQFFKSNWQSNVPNGETSKDFFSRTENAYFYIIEDIKKLNLDYAAVVTHGGVIMSIFSRYDKQKLNFYDYLPQNGNVYYAEIDDKNYISIIEKL